MRLATGLHTSPLCITSIASLSPTLQHLSRLSHILLVAIVLLLACDTATRAQLTRHRQAPAWQLLEDIPYDIPALTFLLFYYYFLDTPPQPWLRGGPSSRECLPRKHKMPIRYPILQHQSTATRSQRARIVSTLRILELRRPST
jgi:hypothetical protein